MRLVHTTDLRFEEFLQPEKCVYAIISHRWTEEEVSFEAFPLHRSGQCKGYGWTKITRGCELARSDQIDWLWIDTCCIDKRSSAELSEAINSMYEWYQNAKICYVFLRDVRSSVHNGGILRDERRHAEPYRPSYLPSNVDSNQLLFNSGSDLESDVYELLNRTEAQAHTHTPYRFSQEEFMGSEWFTRGWTLQELLAPRILLFFNGDFCYIGSKARLARLIMAATGIGYEYVTSRQPTNRASVAKRMGWASGRQSTRKEDQAYCLLGLFSVNMPLLYGEGEKAFIRLQLEIIKRYHDESIFAWKRQRLGPWLDDRGVAGDAMLALRAAAFAPPREPEVAQQAIAKSFFRYRHPYYMTHKGLELTLDFPEERMMRLTLESYRDSNFWLLLPLNCVKVVNWKDGSISTHRIALRLRVLYLSTERHAMYALVNEAFDSATDQPKRLEDFGVEDDYHCLGAIGLERPVEYFKVYIQQDGM
ncbi:hypothetical protein LTR37_016220 [Vermiconidia calcicola]|uniref:Uncharacterized protein n=1 Tax=Vermiconidia calcicola TaxID=1690605 RepID=A0ACC3MRB5_9PEZI|nr:hypothetical protein LTR37_016220 [Vermiconidia calcicola]